jgi:hypothetical protein
MDQVLSVPSVKSVVKPLPILNFLHSKFPFAVRFGKKDTRAEALKRRGI